jgi:hypothetical protein
VCTQIVPPPGWATFTKYDRATAAAPDTPLPPEVFPRVKAISQAVSGKPGVLQFGIMERKTPMLADEFKRVAMEREGTVSLHPALLLF